MLARYLEDLSAQTLAEAADGGWPGDGLVEAVYELERNLATRWRVGDFLVHCRRLGLPTRDLELALRYRALAYCERDRVFAGDGWT